MGKPMVHYWYDPFVDMAWWAGAILGMATAGAPFLFYIVSSIIRADAKKGLEHKVGYKGKPVKYAFDTTLISPVASTHPDTVSFERKPEHVVRDTLGQNMLSDLARFAGAGYIHQEALSPLGRLVSVSEGRSNYRA
jgi:hypothetical protein